jgi:hypothetical protein
MAAPVDNPSFTFCTTYGMIFIPSSRSSSTAGHACYLRVGLASRIHSYCSRARSRQKEEAPQMAAS